MARREFGWAKAVEIAAEMNEKAPEAGHAWEPVWNGEEWNCAYYVGLVNEAAKRRNGEYKAYGGCGELVEEVARWF